MTVWPDQYDYNSKNINSITTSNCAAIC